jgi:cephalosporin hydroxylase
VKRTGIALAVLVATCVGCGSSSAELTDEETVARFTQLYGTTKTALWPNRWLGVPTLQNPMDVWVTQEIITEVKPDFVIESGTYKGGSAAIWAMLLEQVNPAGRVITIDIEDQVVAAAKRLPIVQRRVDFLIGSSTDPEIVAEVWKRTSGKRVLVLLDSAHTKEHVLAELEAYSPMVPIGSYLIVQDTGGVLIQDPNPGPAQALEEFLAKDDHFEPDRKRERMLLTMHPKGYLKRVR